MRYTFQFLLVFASSFYIHSQNYLDPSASVSFGLNNHTNRDEPYFIHTDSQKNSYIVGSTEKDSTFTDIVVIKMNTDHKSEWQQIVSFDTDLSYDIPITSHVNDKNELTVLSRSSSSKSLSNGILFLSKFSTDGKLLFKKQINSVDNLDYVDYDYLDWQFKKNGSLSLTFIPKNVNEFGNDAFHFIVMNSDGEVLRKFIKTIPFSDITSKISNNIFYFLVRKSAQDNEQNVEFDFLKISDEDDIEIIELLNSQFEMDYQKLNRLANNTIINIGTNDKYHLTAEVRDLNGFGGNLNMTLISKSAIEYSISSNTQDDYNLVSSYYNENEELLTVAKESNSRSTRFISIDENNELEIIKEIENFPATIQKFNDDGSTYLVANRIAKLFSEELIEINSIDLSTSPNVVDISKIDNDELVVLGFTEQSMFSGSNYRSQIDIICQKSNSSGLLDSYQFSGQGTSRVFQEKLIIDKDDNYYILVSERLGPSNFNIGGSRAPINNRIIKYNSQLEKIWERQAPDDILNIVFNNGRETNYYFDASNDLFLGLSILADDNTVQHSIYKVTSDGNLFDHQYKTPMPNEFFDDDEFIYISNNGFTSPADTHIFKIEKSSGNLISDIEVGNEYVREIFTNQSELFYYSFLELESFANEPDFIKLYKNGNLLYSRELSRNSGIRDYGLTSTMDFLISTDYSGDFLLHKIGFDGSYKTYKASDQISGVKEFENGKFLITLRNGKVEVLSDQLILIASAGSIETHNPRLLSLENHVLVNTPFSNSVKIINDAGLLIDEILLPGILDQRSASANGEDNLILTGDFGARISTFDHFGWRRGFLHEYDLKTTLGLNDISTFKSNDKLTIFPNPTDNFISISLETSNVIKTSIYDLSGKLILETNSNGANVSSLSKGIYMIKVRTDLDQTFSSKFIKN